MRTLSSDSILLLSSLVFSLIMISVGSPKRSYYKTGLYKANVEINKQFQEGLDTFSETIVSFETAVAHREGVDGAYKKLRKHFKEIGFFLEYLDKEAYDKTLNGAPLPKLEEKVADLKIMEPKGLQVIDELMAEPLTEETLSEMEKQIKFFKKSYENLKQFLGNQHLSDRQFFEASRQALVRLASLGITGFDTPGTLQGIEDAHTVMETLQRYFGFYKRELEVTHHTVLYDQTIRLFEKGTQATYHASFNDFDRLIFLKEVVNPLYKNLLEAHLALAYETIDEVAKYLPAINYRATNLFGNDFLDPFYYVSLKDDSLYTKKKALGKLLFYDPILSKENKMSCATCHAPEKAFTDGFPKSLSNTGKAMERNALTLNYAVYATGFFHDLRAKRLEDQFEHVVLNEAEFNTQYSEIIEKLASSPAYQALFREAFPKQKQAIKSYEVDYALAAYVMSLNPFSNAIDNYFTQANTTLSNDVKKGFNLFTGKANCATCHFLPLFSGTTPPLFNDTEAEVIGVPITMKDSTTVDPDLGRLSNGMTQEVAYFYAHSFKTPTLRNIALTAPYMHNGAFGTLEEVVDFYNKGGGAGMGMDLPHQTLASDPLNLTEEEMAQLIAFLESLTDDKTFKKPAEESFPKDFSNPSWNHRALR